ncbi:MAG: hypothetical protein COA99_07340 [Moraxellaceae bacterium]|nr:MAG: hypothetical protein COA99_07340 [Moraxellaceae bacterium]
MSSNNLLTPHLARAITSDGSKSFKRGWFELKRKMSPSLNVVTFYHRVNDPYSYLLLQTIPRFLEDFHVRLEIEFVLDLPSEFNPEQAALEKYALEDAKRLAQFHDLTFPEQPIQPSPEDAFKATSSLLKHKDRPKLLHMVNEITSALWGTSTTTFDSCINRYGGLPEKETHKQIKQNKERLLSNGHYTSAMLHYGGEWYWGVDRLGHLAERLDKPNIKRNTGTIADYQRQYRHSLQGLSTLKRRPKTVHTLDFYFSFRSPYSYIAAERIFKLADLYKFPVNIKPIMPMITRGLSVPKTKRMYIVHDTKREANRYGISFGKMIDPAGEGVERCFALYPYAKAKGKERAYITSISTGIWSEGANVCKDSVLENLVARAGLDWNDAKAWINNKDWGRLAEKNLNDLEALGLWGVPSFQYGDTVVWGQDRLWALEDAILSTDS